MYFAIAKEHSPPVLSSRSWVNILAAVKQKVNFLFLGPAGYFSTGRRKNRRALSPQFGNSTTGYCAY
jgi:hypothetical protein